MNYKICCLLFCLSVFLGNAQKQTALDSLLQVSKSQSGVNLVKTYNEISWEYKNSSADSALVYGKKALQTAKSIQDKKSIASAYNSIASSYEALSQLDSAVVNNKKSLDIKTAVNDTLGIADTYNNLGIIYDTKGNYKAALDNYFSALRIYQKHAKDFNKVPMVYVNIGIVYKKQKAFDKVLDYYKKALDIYRKNNYSVGEVITTGNIGSVLINLKKFEESITYSRRAERLYDSLGYSRYVPYMKGNIAVAKDSLKQYAEARKEYLMAVSAFKKDNNLFELANTKINLGNNYRATKSYNKAEAELNDALKISKENSYKEMEIKALKSIAKVSALSGNFKSAYDNLQAYTIQKDSVFETEKTKAILELDTKYQSEIKDNKILKQRAVLAEKELDISKKRNYILGLAVLAVIFGLLGYLFYNQQRIKNSQLKRENELKEALQKIETQNRLQDQRLRISRDLHDNIGAQLTFIISSIDNLKYGLKLPEKLQNKLTNISEFTSNTIAELRDTIWAMNKNEITFEDLKTRISNFVNKANLSNENIFFSTMVEENISQNRVFTSVQGMNIYRIIQEAINNSYKYAEATKIDILVHEENDKIIFQIKDDGKGFDPKAAELGNGLNNMKKRADEINANFNIDSKISKGTTVKLML